MLKTYTRPGIRYGRSPKRTRELAVQALLYLYFSVAGRCPRVAKSAVAFLVGLVHYLASAKQRAMVAESISRALGATQDRHEIKKHTRGVFIYFGNYLLDLAHLHRQVEQRSIERYRITVQGLANLDEALQSGRPIVFSGLHFGNWDVGLELLNSFLGNRPMIGIVSPMRYRALRDRIAADETGNYREVVAGHQGLAQAMRLLRANGAVVTMLDGPGDDIPRLPTRFLGGKALLSSLPLRLAQKSNALVIPIALAYQSGFELSAYVGSPVEVPQNADREILASSMQALAGQIEPWIQQYPDQWYCFHRIWEQDTDLEDKATQFSPVTPVGTAVGL